MIGFDHVSKTASAEWLTSILTTNGYLLSGEVVDVKQRESLIQPTLTSEFYQVAMEYGPGSTGTRPAECLIKVGKPNRFTITKNEATFYEFARKGEPIEGLVTSFGTQVDEAAQSAVILLELRRDT